MAIDDKSYHYVEADLLAASGIPLTSNPTVFFLPGNGSKSYEISEAFLVQGTKVAYITCSGHRSFYVPALGRFTDPIALNGFTIPGTASLSVTRSGFAPTSNPCIDAPNENVENQTTTVHPVTTPPYVPDIAYEVTPPISSSKQYLSIASSDDGTVLIACAVAGYTIDADGNYLWTGTKGGVYRSTDSGATWLDITPPDWYGAYVAKVSCDSTGNKIVLTSCDYSTIFMSIYTISKDEIWNHTGKYDGCVLISNNGGLTWEDHWPGFGFNPGVYSAHDVLHYADLVGEYSIGTGYDFSYYDTVTNDNYLFMVAGFYSNIQATYLITSWSYVGDLGSYSGSDFSSHVLSISSAYTPYGNGDFEIYDWLISPFARKPYSNNAISKDGQTIVVTSGYSAFYPSAKNAGHYISRDGGSTWTVLNLGSYSETILYAAFAIYTLAMDDTGDIISANSSYSHLSVNNGVSFGAVAATGFKLFSVLSGDGSVLYESIIGESITLLKYTSADSFSAGVTIPQPTFAEYASVMIMSVCTDSSGDALIAEYMALENEGDTVVDIGIAVSYDDGVTWKHSTLSTNVNLTDVMPFPPFFYGTGVLKTVNDSTVMYASKLTKEILLIDINDLTITNISPVTKTRSLDTTTGHCIGTITVSDNTKIDVGETITIDGVVYTFVAFLTGADNEILIGLNANLTADNIATTLNNTYGALITATVVGNVVTVDYLTDVIIEWSTTSDGITLSGLTLYFEYTYETEPATLTGLTSSGYMSDSGFGGLLPALTTAGTSTHSAFVIPYNVLPSLQGAGHVYNAAIDSTVTDDEKIALLSCDNGWMEWYAGLITDPSLTNDENVLLMTQYVGCYLTYTADTVDEWKDPQQTIADGYGDCEDGSILLFSLLVNFGISSSRVRVYTGEIDGAGHAWVAYLRESDNKWITLDWTLGTPWVLVTSLDQVPKTYFDDYWLYTDINSYFSCGTYTEVNTLDEYIASVVGISTNELEYPEYTIEATMDSHISGEIEYPEYEVSGYTGATTESDEPYDELNYPDYTIEATGYGNSIGHNIAFDYPDYTVTGTMSSETFIYTEEDNIDYPDYEVTGTMYVVASMSVSLTYPIHVINLHCLEAISSVPVEWDGTEPHTAIRLNTVNFAASRYSNFRFNSMCNFMGEIICANSSGIVRHTGDTDNGVDIDAYFQLPSADFSTHKAKSYRKIYLEGYLEGELTVTTVVDDVYGSQLNIASLGTESEVQHVFERQKDDRGNLIGLRVANNDGKDFTINSIYATLIASSTLPNGYTGLGRIKFEYPDYEVSASAS